MLGAREWKEFYRQERESLGDAGLLALFDRAPKVVAPSAGHGALVFPHTRLSASGHLIASAAAAIVDSQCETVLAIGVLHGRDRGDASRRKIYGPEVEDEEFSLDNFQALVELAAKRARRRPPRVVARYPFLTG